MNRVISQVFLIIIALTASMIFFTIFFGANFRTKFWKSTDAKMQDRVNYQTLDNGGKYETEYINKIWR